MGAILLLGLASCALRFAAATADAPAASSGGMAPQPELLGEDMAELFGTADFDPDFDSRMLAAGSLGALGVQLLAAGARDASLPRSTARRRAWQRLPFAGTEAALCAAVAGQVWGRGEQSAPTRASLEVAVRPPLLFRAAADGRVERVCLEAPDGKQTWLRVGGGAPGHEPRPAGPLPANIWLPPSGRPAVSDPLATSHAAWRDAVADTRAAAPVQACWEEAPASQAAAHDPAASNQLLSGAKAAPRGDCSFLGAATVHGEPGILLGCGSALAGHWVELKRSTWLGTAHSGRGTTDGSAGVSPEPLVRILDSPGRPVSATTLRLAAPGAAAERAVLLVVTERSAPLEAGQAGKHACEWHCLESTVGGEDNSAPSGERFESSGPRGVLARAGWQECTEAAAIPGWLADGSAGCKLVAAADLSGDGVPDLLVTGRVDATGRDADAGVAGGGLAGPQAARDRSAAMRILHGSWEEPHDGVGPARLEFGAARRVAEQDRSFIASGLLPDLSEQAVSASGEVDDRPDGEGVRDAAYEVTKAGSGDGGKQAQDTALTAMSLLDDVAVAEAVTQLTRGADVTACGLDIQGDGLTDVVVSSLGTYRGAAFLVGASPTEPDEAGSSQHAGGSASGSAGVPVQAVLESGGAMTAGPIAYMAAMSMGVTGCLVDDVDGDGLSDLLLPTPSGQLRGRPSCYATASSSGTDGGDVSAALLTVLETSWDVRTAWLARNGSRHVVALRQLHWSDRTAELAELRKRRANSGLAEPGHPDTTAPLLGMAELLVLDVNETAAPVSGSEDDHGGPTPEGGGGGGGGSSPPPLRHPGIGETRPGAILPDWSASAAWATPHVVVFRAPVWYDPRAAAGPRLEVADIDGDGDEDIVVAAGGLTRRDGGAGMTGTVAARCGVQACPEGPIGRWIVFHGAAAGREEAGSSIEVEGSGPFVDGQARAAADVGRPSDPEEGTMVVDRGMGGAAWRSRATALLAWGAQAGDGGETAPSRDDDADGVDEDTVTARLLVARVPSHAPSSNATAPSARLGHGLAMRGGTAGSRGLLGVYSSLGPADGGRGAATLAQPWGARALPGCSRLGLGRCPEGPVRFVGLALEPQHGRVTGLPGAARDRIEYWPAGAARPDVFVVTFGCHGAASVDVPVFVSPRESLA